MSIRALALTHYKTWKRDFRFSAGGNNKTEKDRRHRPLWLRLPLGRTPSSTRIDYAPVRSSPHPYSHIYIHYYLCAAIQIASLWKLLRCVFGIQREIEIQSDIEINWNGCRLREGLKLNFILLLTTESWKYNIFRIKAKAKVFSLWLDECGKHWK